MRFVKGHGTENDFVILPDPDNALDLSASLVSLICERRRGLGGDGVLHVVRTKTVPEVAELAEVAEWFMDYRNADGGMAEMCGNGIRVFARYLVTAGLAKPGEIPIATRAGIRKVHLAAEGDVTVDMGPARVLGRSRATVAGHEYEGLHIDVGNPHLACVIGDPVAQIDLGHQPGFDPSEFPNGVNIELINAVGQRLAVMRVYERGSGETRSCGTGAVATALAAAHLNGETTGTWTVEVPGGVLKVILESETTYLAGPAVLVASGELTLP